MTKAITIKNAVTVQQGQPTTNSRAVAELFGKRHADVLRALTGIECSEDFRGRNFALTSEKVAMPRGGFREEGSYSMTKDGFVFLVMGFRGAEAARFKEAYPVPDTGWRQMGVRAVYPAPDAGY